MSEYQGKRIKGDTKGGLRENGREGNLGWRVQREKKEGGMKGRMRKQGRGGKLSE